MAALVGELFTSEPELRAAALHLLQAGNETQEEDCSGSVGSKNVRKNGQFSTTQERARRGKVE